MLLVIRVRLGLCYLYSVFKSWERRIKQARWISSETISFVKSCLVLSSSNYSETSATLYKLLCDWMKLHCPANHQMLKCFASVLIAFMQIPASTPSVCSMFWGSYLYSWISEAKGKLFFPVECMLNMCPSGGNNFDRVASILLDRVASILQNNSP